MCVSTLRLLYPVESAPVKEVLKEFFRLIGCIFCEVPVRSEQDAEKELRECGGTEVDIVLNLDVFQWRAILPPPEQQCGRACGASVAEGAGKCGVAGRLHASPRW